MHITKVINIFIFVGFSLLFATCWANNNLRIQYKWNVIDFKYDTDELRQAAIDSKAFIPANVIPVGMDVHEKRLFLSLPRLKRGVPASLAVINLEELAVNDAPALKPFPAWANHVNDAPDIVSPFHIKVDRCNKLWALDTGIDGILNGSTSKRILPPRILVIDLLRDNFVRKHELSSLSFNNSLFSNIVVDDNDCDDIYAYVADAGTPPSLTVYSFKQDKSWQVTHNFFSFDPLAGNFSLLGMNFQTNDALYGLTLTEKKENGYPDLYFHALTSRTEFNVSTSILREPKIFTDKEFQNSVYKSFNVIGKRNTNEQAGVSVYDPKEKVVFYTLPNYNEIGCWRTGKNYSISNVFKNDVEMVYPIDVKIDTKKQLWVLSNNMQTFIYTQLDVAKPNFYIHMASITDAIKNTPCDSNFVEKVKDFVNKLNGNGSDANNIKSITFLTCIASIVLLIKQNF